jgi:hypothetical protein
MDNLYLDENGTYRDITKEPHDLVGVWVTEESVNNKVKNIQGLKQISIFDYN